MNQQLPKFHKNAKRGGVVAVQGLVAILVLVLLTTSTLQWALTVVADQAVNSAATEAARVAARDEFGTSTQQAVTQAAVEAILQANGMDTSQVTVTITNSANFVTVQVQIPFDAAGIPNWTNMFGWSVAGYELQSNSVGWK